MSERLSSSRQDASFPPDDWSTPGIVPVYVRGLRQIFEAWEIDTSYLYRFEFALGRRSTVQGDLLVWALAAITRPVQEVLRARAEDRGTLSVEDMFSDLSVQGRGSNPAAPEEHALLQMSDLL